MMIMTIHQYLCDPPSVLKTSCCIGCSPSHSFNRFVVRSHVNLYEFTEYLLRTLKYILVIITAGIGHGSRFLAPSLTGSSSFFPPLLQHQPCYLDGCNTQQLLCCCHQVDAGCSFLKKVSVSSLGAVWQMASFIGERCNHIMLQEDSDLLPVMAGDKLIGVLRMDELFHELTSTMLNQ